MLLPGLVASCEHRAADREQPEPDRTAERIGKIVYEVQVLSDGVASSDPIRRTVYFDGTRSAVSEQTNDYGFPGATTIFASGRDTLETYVKELPYYTFRMERERVVQEIASPAVQHHNDTKNILGYRCRKITLETPGFRYVIWYAEDVTAADPTHAVLQDPHVPGLILEMDKIMKGNAGWSVHTVVTVFEPDSRASSSVLEVPENAVKATDPNEALIRNRALFEEAMQREKPLNGEEQQRFLGRWRSKGKKHRIELIIERFGEAYTVAERKEGKPFLRGMARFYGNRLLHEQGTAWRTYFLDANGNLRSDQDETLQFIKQ